LFSVILDLLYLSIFFRNVRFLFALLRLNKEEPNNAEKIELILKQVNGQKILEAYLESAPQFILQITVILKTRNIGKTFLNNTILIDVLCMILSKISY